MQTVRLQLDGVPEGARPIGALLRSLLRPGRIFSKLRLRLAEGSTSSLPLASETAVAVPTDAAFDRFAPSGLRPLDQGRIPRTVGALGASVRDKGSAESGREKAKGKPLGLFDWLLLGVEAVGALVVGYLVFQYIYTSYFDTAPHRVSFPSAAHALPATGTPVRTVKPTATATATRFAEVLPPLVGGPSSESPAAEHASIEPSATSMPYQSPTLTIDPQLFLPIRLRIPVMSLDSPVEEMNLDMGNWQVSALNVGHHEGSANPGDTGNVVLAAHRDINSALFRDLDRLQPGDAVYVSNSLREYRYIVQESIVVGPQHTEVMAATTDQRVTLITCTPIGIATQRLVVVALLDASYTP